MNNNTNHIDTLLEAYWEAETTLAQEAELRAYFSGDAIADEHISFQPLFQHFSIQREVTTDLDVEQVLSSIASESKQPFLSKIFSLRRYSMGIAAALTVMLSVVTVFNLQTTTQQSHTIVLDEATETAEALRITKQALALLSSNIDNSSREITNGVRQLKSASILK